MSLTPQSAQATPPRSSQSAQSSVPPQSPPAPPSAQSSPSAASFRAARPFPIPINYFSMALGGTAFGLSLRYGASVDLLPAWVGSTMLMLAGTVWTLLMLAFVAKAIWWREEWLADWQDLIRCCFLSMVPVTTILTGISWLPQLPGLSTAMILLGTVAQLLFAMFRVAGLWRGRHTAAATTPIIYLPTVGAGFVSAMGLSAIGLPDYAGLFFGAGLLSWFGLEASILMRLRTGDELPPPMRGVLGIMVAPSFVACAAYLELNGGKVDIFAQSLLGYGLLHSLFSIRLLPWLTEAGFVMSLWGYSFALAAMTGCGLRLMALHPPLAGLGWGMAWFAGILMLALMAATVRLAVQGRFLVRG